jgi:hypothetical protein
MADFALWATACESAFRPAGTLETAYANNRREAIENSIDADPGAARVREIMADRAQWTGSASDLLQAGTNVAGNSMFGKRSGSPKSPRALAGRLRRAQTFLRTVGIEIVFGREGRLGTRTIRITATEENRLHDTVSFQPRQRHEAECGASSAFWTGTGALGADALTVLTQNSQPCGVRPPPEDAVCASPKKLRKLGEFCLGPSGNQPWVALRSHVGTHRFGGIESRRSCWLGRAPRCQTRVYESIPLPPTYNIVRVGDSLYRGYGGVCVQEEQKHDRNCSPYSPGAGAATSIVWSATVA